MTGKRLDFPRRLSLDETLARLQAAVDQNPDLVGEIEPPRETEPDPWQLALRLIVDLPALYLRRVPEPTALPLALAGWGGSPWVVILHGATGSGKTWLAVQMLGRYRQRGRQFRARFADATEAVDSIREEMATPADGTTRGRLCDRAIALLLDDLGSERETDFARDKLGGILRFRYGAEAPTIVTTNRSPEELAEIYPRELSRMGEGLFFEVIGGDRRLRPA